jgi:hypothetical protein
MHVVVLISSSRTRRTVPASAPGTGVDGSDEFASPRARRAARATASKFPAFRSRSVSRRSTRAGSGSWLPPLSGTIVLTGTTMSAVDLSLVPHFAAKSATAATGPRSAAASSFRAATPRTALTGPRSTMHLLHSKSHRGTTQIPAGYGQWWVTTARVSRRVGAEGVAARGPLRDKLADAPGYPLPLHPSCGKPTPRVSDGAVGAAFQAGARDTRSRCEMTTSPTTDNQDRTARQTLYTVCY